MVATESADNRKWLADKLYESTLTTAENNSDYIEKLNKICGSVWQDDERTTEQIKQDIRNARQSG